MAKGRCNGQMDDGIAVNTIWTRSQVKVHSPGAMDAAIEESGTTESSMERVYSCSRMGKKSRVNGSTENESAG